jgi:RNA polymerase-interacting CarD/CdnL/TRCF family regulator
MQYAIGDTVVHPHIGAGTIIDTRHQELMDGFEHYYVIEIPTRDSTVFIPMRKMDEVGVRR